MYLAQARFLEEARYDARRTTGIRPIRRNGRKWPRSAAKGVPDRVGERGIGDPRRPRGMVNPDTADAAEEQARTLRRARETRSDRLNRHHVHSPIQPEFSHRRPRPPVDRRILLEPRIDTVDDLAVVASVADPPDAYPSASTRASRAARPPVSPTARARAGSGSPVARPGCPSARPSGRPATAPGSSPRPTQPRA